ncbi:MAG: hypothetical protein RR512_07905 [Coprobacillus sp.]
MNLEGLPFETEEEFLNAIKKGEEDIEAGRVVTLEEFWEYINEKLGWDF